MHFHRSYLFSVCVMQCNAFLSKYRTLWLLIHVLMWQCMWSSSIEVYILASCRRYTSLESQLSFWDYLIAWRVTTSEWFPYKACLSCICYSFLDQGLGIFCVLLKSFYWLQTLILNRFTFHDSRGSDNRGKCQEVFFFSFFLPQILY